MDENLADFDLSKGKDDLVRMGINLDKSRLGCGYRFEWGDYIGGKICERDRLCEDCERKIEENEAHISIQETLILGIQIAKSEFKLDRVIEIIHTGYTSQEKITKIEKVLDE